MIENWKKIILEEVDSTNIELKRQAEAGAKEGTLLIAERQLKGKGRQGRPWDSPKGSSIAMSFLLKPELTPEKAARLTLVTALAVSRAVEKVTGLKALIKWPNDLVINGKKICGILTEMSTGAEGVRYVVVGIGMNVNIEAFREDLPYATSLRIEGGRSYSREALIDKILSEFSVYYERFLKTGSLEGLLEEYNKRLVNRDSRVQIIKEKETMQGTARGVNAEGELIVETENGLETVLFGEVSVRGVYGYV